MKVLLCLLGAFAVACGGGDDENKLPEYGENPGRAADASDIPPDPPCTAVPEGQVGACCNSDFLWEEYGNRACPAPLECLVSERHKELGLYAEVCACCVTYEDASEACYEDEVACE